MKSVRCPICGTAMPGQAAEWPDYPFCSARCRKIDLGRWLGEKYAIPAEDQSKGDAEATTDE
jgi:endogenous inhibitor of DNA gyrase (YacG/DUF329 family)